MTPEDRKSWEVTRAKGYNHYLLMPDLESLSASWVGITIYWWGYEYSFSLSALKTGSFWALAGAGLFGIYLVRCFFRMFLWKHKEMEYLSGTENGHIAPTP